MGYKLDPNAMYRMPTHFGPRTGPRYGPDGRKFECKGNPKSTSVSVSFLTNSEQLEAFLPPGFSLNGDPVVSVSGGYMKEIEWLADADTIPSALVFQWYMKVKWTERRGLC